MFKFSKLALDLQGFFRRIKDKEIITGKFVPVSFLRGIDIIKFSIEDMGKLIYDKAFFNEMITVSERDVCITIGEKGSLLFTKHGIWHAPIYPVKNIIDPTGSGDIFLGAFVYAILSGMRPNESLSFATAAASLFMEKMDFSKDTILHRMRVLVNTLTYIADKTYEEILFH